MNHRHLRPRLAQLTCWTALLAVIALYGCAGDGPPPQAAGSAFDVIQRDIFNPNCLGAGCHNSQAQAGGMDLSAGVSFGELVNVVPDNLAAASAGMLRVEPFDPTNSFLLTKLIGPSPAQGARMPQGMNPLPQADIDQIRAWIVAGAPPGGTAVPTASVTAAPPTATDTMPPATVTVTPTPVNTASATITVTGTAPATATVTITPTITETPSPEPSPTPTPTQSLFQQIQATIFNPTCIDMFCHDAQGTSGSLALVEGLSYAQLVDVLPANIPARDAGLLRVDPFDPANSFLVVKVEGPTNPAMGLRMPVGKPPLTPQQIELIREWITEGAAE